AVRERRESPARAFPHCRRRGSAAGCGSSGSASRNPGRTARRPDGLGNPAWSAGPAPRREVLRSPRRCCGEMQTLAMLGLLARIECGNRAVIAHHAGPDFATLALVLGQLAGWVHGDAPFA